MISNNRGDTSIRVLHVDDEDNQLVMTKIFIERNNPNINVTSANTITEAFNLIESSEFDCIISDYKMPEMTGVEFVEKIRESSNIPFILYTGQGSEEVASAAFLAGVDDYLRKEIEPSHYQVLTNRVRKVVEQYRAEISLEESENRFRGIAERSFEAIVILDINGYVTYASPAVEKLTGNTPDSFIGKFFMDFISFPSMEDATEAFNKLQNGGSIENIIVEAHNVDGRKLILETNASPIVINGEMKGYQAVYRDVSKRLEMEKQLQESEKRYRTMFENMEDAVAVYEAVNDGEDFIIKDFNPAAEKIEKVSRSEIIGKRVTSIFPGIRDFHIFTVFQRVWKTGESEHHPVSYYQDDRIKGWRENYVYKLPSGEVVAIYQDLSEKQKLSLNLTKSEQLYRTVVENSPNAISITVGKKIVYANKKRAELYGVEDPRELVGKYVNETVHEDDLNKILKLINDRINGKTTKDHMEFKLVNKNGKVRQFIAYSSPVIYENEQGTIHVFHDITDIIKIEEELREYTEEMEKKVEEQAEKLLNSERIVTTGRIAAMVGHDIQGPLQTIKSGIYLLKNSDEDRDETIEVIENAVDRAAEMIHELRDRVRIQPIKPARIELPEFIEYVVTQMHLPEKVSTFYEHSKELTHVWLDRDKIQRVIENLTRNAVEAIPDVGTITYRTLLEDDTFKIDIIDTGTGISKEDRATIFKPFYTTKEKGLGLGLSLSKRVVEAHGGTISLESEPGEGTTVSIILPYRERL